MGRVMVFGRVMMMMFVVIMSVMMMVIFDESVGVVHLRRVEELVVKFGFVMSVVMFVVESEENMNKRTY